GRVGHLRLDLGKAGLYVPQLLEGDPVHGPGARAAGAASGLRGSLLGAGLGARGLGGAVLAREALDAAGRVHEALLAREERVAVRADLEAQLLLGGARGPGGAAGAVDVDDRVVGVDSSFHGFL